MFRKPKKTGARSARAPFTAKPTSFNVSFLAHSYENESAHKDTMATSLASCLSCNYNLSNILLHANLKKIFQHKAGKRQL
jgi:hypothetical protein